MTQPAKGQELSMDEILASIRRIITDDPPGASRTEASRSESLRTDPAGDDGQGREDAPHAESLRTEGLRAQRLRTENLWSESTKNESRPHEKSKKGNGSRGSFAAGARAIASSAVRTSRPLGLPRRDATSTAGPIPAPGFSIAVRSCGAAGRDRRHAGEAERRRALAAFRSPPPRRCRAATAACGASRRHG